MLTVPAHMWLWNRDDAIAGHKRRYTKKELVKNLENNGFKVLEAKYFFISIVPLLILRSLLNRDDGSEVKQEEFNKEISINTIMNKILLVISRLENKFSDYLLNFFGGSLFVIGEKN